MVTIRRSGAGFEAKLAEIAANVSTATKVRVGFLEGATYPDGKPVALVAAIQEYGAPAVGVPPRPFIRNMIAEKSDEWPDAAGNLLVINNYDAEKTLGQVGEAIKGQMQQSIIDTNEPPLAQSTIDRKGFDKPLVDTGHMLNTVNYEVE